MEWKSATFWMFFVSILLGMFITTSLLVNSAQDIRLSLVKFYQAIFMALWMVLLGLYMYPQVPTMIYIITFVAILAVLYMARQQVGVSDREYLRAMIQHHSIAILTSKRIIEKTQDEKVKKLAQDIISAQEYEIELINKMLE